MLLSERLTKFVRSFTFLLFPAVVPNALKSLLVTSYDSQVLGTFGNSQLTSSLSGWKPGPPPLPKPKTLNWVNLFEIIFCGIEPKNVCPKYNSLKLVGILLITLEFNFLSFSVSLSDNGLENKFKIWRFGAIKLISGKFLSWFEEKLSDVVLWSLTAGSSEIFAEVIVIPEILSGL